MKKTWLVLDVNYLAHRAFHTTGSLKWGKVQTGVTYGLFRDILNLQERFGAQHLAFCFDYGKSIRKEILPCYKKKRNILKLSDQHKVAYGALEKEVNLLREMYLPYLGFENVFFQKGYEADDVIAQVCREVLDRKDDAVIVSADKDLWQLLQKGICMYNPHHKTIATHKSFFEEWGMLPDHWPKIKAVAGCSTDEIPGITGVGEKTAKAFYLGKLTNDHKMYQPIVDWVISDKYRLNFTLVKLPLEGCERVKLVEDKINLPNWRRLTKRLGMKSLQNRNPGVGFGFKKVPLGD